MFYFYSSRIDPDCTGMELIHKTPTDEVPQALCPFQGKLLVGVGKMLRLYDMGKKKLLRKCENKVCDMSSSLGILELSWQIWCERQSTYIPFLSFHSTFPI